jgi:hypothetical protein
MRPALARAGCWCAAALAIACQTSAPSADVAVPPQVAPAAPLQPSPAVQPPAASAAALLERIHDLAAKLGPGLTKKDVETAFDVQLAGSDSAFSGASRTWPAKVQFVPSVDQQEPSLHLSFDDFEPLEIGDLETRFGPAEYHVDAKQSVARYRATPDVYLHAKYLGGWNPSSPVSAIRLELIDTKPPPKGDLFK